MEEREGPARYPIPGAFVGCCASALAPHTVSATTIAKSPAHFRFWILRRGSGHALDFRLSEEESKNRFQKVLFMQFLQSKIENRQSKMSFYDFVCPRQHVRWNRQADLHGRLQIDNELELHRLLDGSSAGFAPFRILSTTQRPTNASYPCIDHQQNRSRPAL